ncbi:MAG: hypothetical protein ACOYCE_04365 [Limnochordia bacterium]
MTNTERAANCEMWEERIRDLEASGPGVREWCEANGLKMSAVYQEAWVGKVHVDLGACGDSRTETK